MSPLNFSLLLKVLVCFSPYSMVKYIKTLTNAGAIMTYKEAAALLNISPTALSLILNGKPGVSQETRDRVMQQITEIGIENFRSRNAPAKKSSGQYIGFLIYKKSGAILDAQPFFLLIMESLENESRRFGYNIVVATYDARSDTEKQIEYLKSMDVCGFVIFATEMDYDDLSIMKRIPKPFILLDNDFPYSDVSSVTINNELGAYKAVHHLIDQGHTQIGYLRSEYRINSFRERCQGYRDALKEFGLSIRPELIFDVPFTEEGSYYAFRKYLESGRSLPSALLSDCDTMALGALRALKEMNYRVPEDISIIGFDDRPICALSEPALTSVSISKHSFGAEAIDTLIDKISSIQENADGAIGRSIKIRIGAQLIVRDSVVPPRSGK